jgi:hypothetical protein
MFKSKRFSSDYASSFSQRDSTLEVVTSARKAEGSSVCTGQNVLVARIFPSRNQVRFGIAEIIESEIPFNSYWSNKERHLGPD